MTKVNANKNRQENPNVIDYLVDLDVNGTTILKRIFDKQVVTA